MPAIQPAKLKKEAVELAAKIESPAAFVRNLHALLDHYTDHTHRSGQAGEPYPLLDVYKTPPAVLNQVWVELTRQAKLHPDGILPLCDALFAEPNFDLQLLATRLLGQATIDPPGPVLERLQTWVHAGLEMRVLDSLLVYGTQQFQMHAPRQIMEIISGWLTSTDLPLQQAGLHALLTLSDYPGIENLPAVLKLITPYLRIAPSRLRPDILAVLTVLARTSPSETAYLLRQNLSVPDNPDTAWLIRQVMSEFPEETRAGLRAAMKSTKP
jgi:hypothetical protein